MKAYYKKNGAISYDLLNKALIQAACSNSCVDEQLARGASQVAIL